MFHMNFRLCLMHLSSIKIPKISATSVHHLLLIDHLMMIRRLKLWRGQTRSTVVHWRSINVTLLDLLAELIIHWHRPALPPNRRRIWWRWHAVVHWHLFSSFSRVISVEQRLLWWKIYFCCDVSLRLALMTRKSSTTRRCVVLCFHYFIRRRYISIIVTSTPVLKIKDLSLNTWNRFVLILPLRVPSLDVDNEFVWLVDCM